MKPNAVVAVGASIDRITSELSGPLPRLLKRYECTEINGGKYVVSVALWGKDPLKVQRDQITRFRHPRRHW
jgi:hypothetical protein